VPFLVPGVSVSSGFSPVGDSVVLGLQSFRKSLVIYGILTDSKPPLVELSCLLKCFQNGLVAVALFSGSLYVIY
jgi:hypothetical protein